MNALDKDIAELRIRLNDGSMQRAYRGIISYMSQLRMIYITQEGECAVSHIYQGYLDITYFALFSEALKVRGLKLAILFNYEAFSFEVWLTARNKRIQKRYRELLLNGGYEKHAVIETEVESVAIAKAILAVEYSLEAKSQLNEQIIESVQAFEDDITMVLDQVDVV